jgi:tetratricopeptide (TPR) repeat protein
MGDDEMRSWLIAPTLLLLTSAAPPPPAPFDLSKIIQMCRSGVDRNAPLPEKTELLTGYGQGGFAIRAAKAEAQAFFDNGMQLGHAFDHKASIAAFEEARRIDPSCAMCAWGEAWSKGPTLNYGVSEQEAAALSATATEALRLSEGSSAIERALIAAMVTRYAGGTVDHAGYAAAMDAIANANPDSDSLTVLAAEAWMIAANPWEKGPEGRLERPVSLLEMVLNRTPDYAPAIHFYIHATEFAGYPKRAEPYADRLGDVAPAASHLVHMPSHTYYWVGRYADAAAVNLRAVEIGNADARRLNMPGPHAAWAFMYHSHNVHFGLGAALISGDASTGLALARPMIEMSNSVTTLSAFDQLVLGHAYITIARFAPVEEMLGIPRPGDDRPAAQALWHYARGEAFARKGDANAVRAEARRMPRRLAGSADPISMPLLRIGRDVLEGRAAMIQGRYDRALKRFTAAAAIEESSPVVDAADPPIWWYPVRRDIAAALLAKGDAAGAVREATATLALRPNDPVTLEIRGRAQAKLGNARAAARDLRAARAGWRA